MNGRRIVDIGSLLKQVEYVYNHSNSCTSSDVVLTKEIKKGLNSIFEYHCSSCLRNLRVETNPKKNSIGINEAAVAGINSIGLGMYHLEEFCAHLNVPPMSTTLYNSVSMNQQKDWWYLAKRSASDALDEEIRLAKSNNEIDSAGNALITIMVDGSWSKRSYGRNYSALSGCAAIIGLRTRKIVYFDIRNKYCHTCTLAEKKKVQVKEHVCNKNYDGPSSGMESDIIVAGFRECELRGARFNKFVADGDSNTYKILRDIRIYKDPDIMIEKFECVNHLYRNFEKKVGDLSGKTQYAKKARNCIPPSLSGDICKGIRMATKHWQEANEELITKIYNLELDAMNATDHYLGFHEKCSEYFCDKTEEEGSSAGLALLKESKLYYDILNACQHFFADNAKSLLANYSTNDNESFNNLVAKYLAGKRINYSLGGSYKARVARAALQCNSGGQSGFQFHNYKSNDPPQNLLKMELNRKRKCTAHSEAKKRNPPKKRKVRGKHSKEESRKGYGDNCQTPDMEPAAFQRSEERFLKKLKEDQAKRCFIEQDTIGQRHTPYWFEIRQNLLTASHFHRVTNARSMKSFKGILG